MPIACDVRRAAGRARAQRSSASPGARTLTSTAGATLAAARANSWGGSVSRRARSRWRRGKNVPQWIGTAMPRLDQRERLGRALGIEVPRAELRPPAPDRDQGEVERAQLGHLVEQIGVAGEVDAQAVPLDDEAERLGLRAQGRPGSRRARRARRAHVRRRSRSVPPGASSVSAAKPSLAASRPAPTGTTSRVRSRSRSRSEGRSRWSWWTCEMSTASSSSWCARIDRPADAPQVQHALAQHRVGQDARAAELDQHRRVPEPGDAARHR